MALKNMNDQLLTSGNLQDFAAYDRMETLIQQAITESKAANLADNKTLDDAVQKHQDDFSKGLEKHMKADDEIARDHLIYMAFMLCASGIIPLSPLSFFFNNLGFGNFLSGSSFVDATSSLFKSDALGFVGDMADTLGVDDLVSKILTDVPFIKEIPEIFDFFIQNDIAQNAIGVAAPLIDSPLLPICIGATWSLMRAATEIEQQVKVGKFLEEKEKDFEKIIDAYPKTQGDPLRRRIEAFVKQEFQIRQLANFEVKMVEFISSFQDDFAPAFSGIKLKDKSGAALDLLQLKNCKQTDVLAMLRAPENNKAAIDFAQSFLLFSAKGNDVAAVQTINPQDKAKVAKDQRTYLDQECIFELADKAAWHPSRLNAGLQSRSSRPDGCAQ